MNDAAHSSEARIRINDPLSVLRSVCTHFSAHGTVTYGLNSGVIESGFGRAELRADNGVLHLRAEASDATALYVVRNALAEQLVEHVGEGVPFCWMGQGADHATIPFFRQMHVVGAAQLTPHMRRVTLAGDVAHFDSPAGMHVRLLIPPRLPAVWPRCAPDGRTLWAKGEDALIRRVYTIRRIDRTRGTLDIDIALHDDEIAPGSNWARSVQLGDTVGLMGPGGGMPPPADWYLLAGDETALPVIARLAETATKGQRIMAFIEVDDAQEEQVIVPTGDVTIRWLHRNGAAAGTTDLLERALRAMQWPQQGAGYALVGCEHRAARAIRGFLMQEREMERGRVNAAAYWRRGRDGDSGAEQERE